MASPRIQKIRMASGPNKNVKKMVRPRVLEVKEQEESSPICLAPAGIREKSRMAPAQAFRRKCQTFV